MIKQCAWCGKFMGMVKCEKTPTYLVTHGMCPTCFDREMKKLSASREQEARCQASAAGAAYAVAPA